MLSDIERDTIHALLIPLGPAVSAEVLARIARLARDDDPQLFATRIGAVVREAVEQRIAVDAFARAYVNGTLVRGSDTVH